MKRCNICQRAYSKSMCRKWTKRRRNLWRFASAVLDGVTFGCCSLELSTGRVTNGDKISSTAGDGGECPNIVFIIKLLVQSLKTQITRTNKCYTLSLKSRGTGLVFLSLNFSIINSEGTLLDDCSYWQGKQKPFYKCCENISTIIF